MQEIRDIDYLDAESEIDALLMEARLIKDILPKFNRDLRDDKTFPYLEIFTHEDFPRVRFTREPKSRGTKLYGPFANPRGLRGAIQVLQKIFKFRTCTLDIDENDQRWRWFRPCLLASIAQCTAPCNLRISKEEYRKNIRRLQRFLEGGKNALLRELREEMAAAAKELHFEEAGRLRDEIEMIESLDDRGELETHVQPEVFPIDPKRGLAGLQKVLHLTERPRTIEGIDMAHTGRHGNRGQPWCSSSTGCRSSRATADEDSGHGRARRCRVSAPAACSGGSTFRATVRPNCVSMARKTRPMPPPPTYSSSSKCPIRSPGITRPSRIRAAESEAAGAGIGGELVMTVRSSAGGLSGPARGRTSHRREPAQFRPTMATVRAFERWKRNRSSGCCRETDAAHSAAAQTEPGAVTAAHPCCTNHPTPGTNARQEKFFISQNLHFSRRPKNVNSAGSIGGG